jgi:hypothetical protein
MSRWTVTIGISRRMLPKVCLARHLRFREHVMILPGTRSPVLLE